MSSDIRKWVEEHLDVRSISGDEAQALCLFHPDSSPSMYVNVEKGLFTCFACGAGGHVNQIAEKLGVPSPDEPLTRRDPKSRDISPSWVRDQIIRLQEIRLDQDRPDHGGLIVLPERELAQFDLPSDCWADRGITDEVVELFGLCYDLLNYAMTVPLRTLGGGYLGVLRRHLDPEVQPRYLYPAGFKKSLVLFGAHKAKLHPKIAITEGSIDALRCWSLGIPAVAVLGSELSWEQSQMLLGMGCDRYVAIGDGDAAGRKLNVAIQAALGRSCVALAMPEGEDPGSVSEDVLRGLWEL